MTQRGTVKVYFDERGFGFIQPDNGSDPDLFVHVRDVEGGTPLQKGDVVDVETGTSQKNGKPCARNVRPIEGVRLNRPVQFGARPCVT